MVTGSLQRIAAVVALVASVLFLVVLSLDWQVATVRVPGVVELRAGASGWSGAGLLAGLSAIVVVAAETARLRGRSVAPVFTAGAALVALGAMVVALLVGDADVVAPVGGAAVEVDSTRWPAWAGLVLAAVAAAAALIALQRPTSSSDSARRRAWASGS
jgi:hypothetical protein